MSRAGQESLAQLTLEVHGLSEEPSSPLPSSSPSLLVPPPPLLPSSSSSSSWPRLAGPSKQELVREGYRDSRVATASAPRV